MDRQCPSKRIRGFTGEFGSLRNMTDIFFLASDDSNVWEEEEFLWDDSEERLNDSSDLDREWRRRHDQFFTVT